MFAKLTNAEAETFLIFVVYANSQWIQLQSHHPRINLHGPLHIDRKNPDGQLANASFIFTTSVPIS